MAILATDEREARQMAGELLDDGAGDWTLDMGGGEAKLGAVAYGEMEQGKGDAHFEKQAQDNADEYEERK